MSVTLLFLKLRNLVHFNDTRISSNHACAWIIRLICVKGLPEPAARNNDELIHAFFMDKIHFGNEIRRVMELRGTSAAEVAKALNLHVHSVYDMLKRENIDVYRLMELSELLNYDFLQVVRLEPLQSPDWCEISVDNEKIVIVKK